MESASFNDLLSKLNYEPKISGPTNSGDASYQMLRHYEQMHKNMIYPEDPKAPEKLLVMSEKEILREFDYLFNFTSSEKSADISQMRSGN